jgi:hypothetical protein
MCCYQKLNIVTRAARLARRGGVTHLLQYHMRIFALRKAARLAGLAGFASAAARV